MDWTRRGWTLVGMLLLVAPGALRVMTVPVSAQVSAIATTTVTDTVYRADGTTAAGTVLVSWQAFTTAIGQTVAAGTTSATIGAGGGLSVALAPNAGATPLGSYYTAVYHLDDGTVSREFWVVPVSASPVQVSGIRSTVLPASVAMQTVSKSYVDTAIATAVSGHPLDGSSPFTMKAGDAMTGPLVLPGDPVAANQAADKHYVDVNTAAVQSGLAQKVALAPVGSQTVVQPAGTQMQVNRLNGTSYPSQYVTGLGNNGIGNTLASADCAAGCDVKVDRGYASGEGYYAGSWNSDGGGGTHVEDERGGGRRDSFLNPTSPVAPGQDAGEAVDVVSTRNAAAEFASGRGTQEPTSVGMFVTHEGLTGGNNLFPAGIENVPYFKSNYAAMPVQGTYNTQGQHSLMPLAINCYGVGDCLIGAQVINASGGFRDEADEGSHPYDLALAEDVKVFAGTCSAGCTAGSTLVTVGSITAQGTQGEGRFVIDKNPAKVITAGLLTGGTGQTSTRPGAGATFSGSNFPVSVFLATAQMAPSQANNIAAGMMTMAIATSGVPAGFATSTAAIPGGGSAGTGGVACVTEPYSGYPHNYEMVNYTVVDGTHLQMTFNKVHRAGATIAVGGLCGYGLEETVDTARGIRQVFPVIGSYSATGLYYAGGATAIVGVSGQTGGFLNVNLPVATIARTNNVVTVTTAAGFPLDVNGLTMTVAGVADASYNGSFTVTTTGTNMLTYAASGPDGTSTGGSVAALTGGYALYPMAEVLGVFDAAAKSVDGQLTLAPNTVAWAQGDAVEEPHYYQEAVGGDITFVAQTTPRPTLQRSSGIEFDLSASTGLLGWQVNNAVPAQNYLGNGGTHAPPQAAFEVNGIWQQTMNAQAGEQSVFAIHCNSHGCGRWNSGYDLFELDTTAGFDWIRFQPMTSALTLSLRSVQYGFTPQGFTAGTVNAGVVNGTTVNATTINAPTINAPTINTTTINATTLNVPLSAAQLPVFQASGSGHAAGAVPDPGATAGATRYLREDGAWTAMPAAVPAAGNAGAGAGSGMGAGQIGVNLLARFGLMDGSGAPKDSSGNGNDALLPGGGANPVWTAQGISCDGSAQRFRATGTRGARTFVWSSTEAVPMNSAFPAGPTYVTPFGVADLSVSLGGNNYYGSHPGVALYRTGVYNDRSSDTLQGTHTFALTLGSDSASDPNRFYIDGAETTYTGARGAAAGVATADYDVCGISTGYPTYFPGAFYYFEAFSDEKTAAQVQQETAAVTQIVASRGVAFKAAPDPTIRSLYVAVGDSLTEGEGPQPSSRFIAPGDAFDVLNLGLGSANTDDLLELFEAREATLYRRNAGRNVLRLWAGTNDVSGGGRTPQQALDGIRSYCRKAKAAGFQTIVSDMISRTGNDNNMLALNALLTSEDTGCDLVLDLASNPLLGAVGANASTTYYQGDDLHLSLAGQQNLVAPAETRAIDLLAHLKSSNTSATVTAAAYTIADYDLYLPVDPASNSVAATLPDCSYFTGMVRSVKNLQSAGANAVTVVAMAGQTIDGSAGAVTVGNGATLVLRQIVPNRTTGGCMWVKVSDN